MDALHYSERKKYKQIWDNQKYTSPNAINFAKFVDKHVTSYINDEQTHLLEIGCGDSTTLNNLKNVISNNTYGLDIYIKEDSPYLFEATVWDMSFIKVPFDYTISTDVLEHIPPEMVEKTIKEIIRVTHVKTIHAISTKPAVKDYCGHKVHLTVKPLQWWQEQFKKHLTKEIEIILIDADDPLLKF